MNRRLSVVHFVCFVAALGVSAYGGAAELGKLPNIQAPKSVNQTMFSSTSDQSLISSDEPLGKLALANSLMSEKATQMGFAAKSPEAKLFLIGSYYSEALALNKSHDNDEALKRIVAIKNMLIELGAPAGLYSYVTHLESLMLHKEKSEEMIADYMSMMQPLLDDYAQSLSADKHTLFRTGTWLVDMGLAAAAGDVSLLKQDDRIGSIIADMKRMDAPKGAQDALEEIKQISSKQDVDKHDAKKILSLVKKMQSVLS